MAYYKACQSKSEAEDVATHIRKPGNTPRGYAAFKNGKQWSDVYDKETAKRAAKYMRESKYKQFNMSISSIKEGEK